MTNEKALQELKASIVGQGFQCHPETYQKAIEALEKQIPKKPVIGDTFSDEFRKELEKCINAKEPLSWQSWCCPVCNKPLVRTTKTTKLGLPNNCKCCGQALNWEDF